MLHFPRNALNVPCRRVATGFAVLWMITFVVLPLCASVKFDRPFAPSDSFVKGPESQYRDNICLNGNWQFEPVDLPKGFREGTDPAPSLPLPSDGKWEKVPIRIPSPWNVNSFGDRQGLGGDFRAYPSYPAAWEKVEMGWLRRTVLVPERWKGDRVILHFSAAAGDLRILINGKDAGKQSDLFFPFELDVTNLVKFGGQNEILVGVRKLSLSDVKGKYGRRTYQGGSFWGQHIAGLWQDVDLVAEPNVRVTDVYVQPDVDKDTLRAEVTLRNDTDLEVSVDLDGAIHRWMSLAPREGVDAANPDWKLDPATSLGLRGSPVSIPAHGEQTVQLEQKVKLSLDVWSPENPALYGLVLNVSSGGHQIDCKYQRFGWRQFKLHGSELQLNGKLITLKGDSWHFLGIPQMTRRYARAWFSAMHDANLNAVRLHAEPYPEFYLDVADEMGIMVLDETAIWASDGGPKLDSVAFWEDTKGHVEQLVRRDRNHPSIFGWSVANEVRPIVQGVFHNPPGMFQQLLAYYTIWADICRRLDPTRPWISADGDDDGGGKLPVYVVHYGGTASMERAAKSGKPWGVGEAGGAYYATPLQVAKTNDERAYASFEGRMEGIAIDSYSNLLSQRKLNAGYRSIFNLVWYGLQPLELGLPDTTRPPTIEDGIFFPDLVDGKPGIQPERLGPYSTTLNPGYDPGLPAYRKWPLFDAIHDANNDPVVSLPWTVPPPVASSVSAVTSVKSIALLAGEGSRLQTELAAEGVPFGRLKKDTIADLLFVDGQFPPSSQYLRSIQAVLSKGGTVVVWGTAASSLDRLNALMPWPLQLTDRHSSSLLPVGDSRITAGLKPSDLYFSETTPPDVLTSGLGGSLVTHGTVLLQAPNTDWLSWNKQPEYAKTAMVLRSERETKPSGIALLEVHTDIGRLIISNLPAWSPAPKLQGMVRTLLRNMGVPLDQEADAGYPFLSSGKLAHTLAIGRFPLSPDGVASNLLDPASIGAIKEGDRIQNERWAVLSSGPDGSFDLNASPLSGADSAGVVYLSFWLQSPRSLDNLLLEPNVPKLDLSIQNSDAYEIFLNGKSIYMRAEGKGIGLVSSLPLQQGWNHVLLRIQQRGGSVGAFQAQLQSSDPEYLQQLKSSLEKP